MARNLEELKRTLGFPGPWSSRLDEALTHRSYAVENNLAYDNQRLEFLGDAVLEIILTEYLFNLYPDAPEGEMTKMRSALVREAALARLAAQVGHRACGHVLDKVSTVADVPPYGSSTTAASRSATWSLSCCLTALPSWPA